MEKLLSSYGSTSEEKKVPTLKQWIKRQGKKPFSRLHRITIVWKPNQYPNITFQTEEFLVRLNITKESMSEHVKLLRQWFMSDLPIAIEIGEEDDGSFDVAMIEDGKVEWTELGTNGYKLEWAKRDSAKPVTESTRKKNGSEK